MSSDWRVEQRLESRVFLLATSMVVDDSPGICCISLSREQIGLSLGTAGAVARYFPTAHGFYTGKWLTREPALFSQICSQYYSGGAELKTF